jgi:hypothetical protein
MICVISRPSPIHVCVLLFEPTLRTDIKFTLAVSDLDSVGLCKSDTVWLDPLVTSMFCVVNASFTSDARTFVEQIEYLSEIPSALPVLPRTVISSE